MKRQIIFIFMLLSAIVGSMARQPERGYRGFLDWSNSLRSEKWVERYTKFYSGVSTSHGYQFNPWLYVGGGLDWEYHSSSNTNIFAVFVDGRTDLKFGKFTPFGDVRIGYRIPENGYKGDFYFSPSIGYRFSWGRKVGINLGVGITVTTHREKSDYILDEDFNLIHTGQYNTWSVTNTYFSFRVGFDF